VPAFFLVPHCQIFLEPDKILLASSEILSNFVWQKNGSTWPISDRGKLPLNGVGAYFYRKVKHSIVWIEHGKLMELAGCVELISDDIRLSNRATWSLDVCVGCACLC